MHYRAPFFMITKNFWQEEYRQFEGLFLEFLLKNSTKLLMV